MGKHGNLLLLGAGVTFPASVGLWTAAAGMEAGSRWAAPFFWLGMACLIVGLLCLVVYKNLPDENEASAAANAEISAQRTAVYNELGRFLEEGTSLKHWLHRQADRYAHPTSSDARMLLKIADEKMQADGLTGDASSNAWRWRDKLLAFVQKEINPGSKAELMAIDLSAVPFPDEFPTDLGLRANESYEAAREARHMVEALVNGIRPLLDQYRP